MTTLKSKDLNVQINAGELVSLIKNKHEFIHQKGSPGWSHSDTEMFPVIGPTDDAQFKVKTPQKTQYWINTVFCASWNINL